MNEINEPATKLRDAVRDMARDLTAIYGEREARAMADIAVEHLTGYTAVDRVLKGDEPISGFRLGQLNGITERLINGEPLQYILGEASFYGMKFIVNPSVLIPRPETEELVDMIVKQNAASDLRVLDIGTGSGCIAIALARNLKFANVTGTDISDEALATARQNASNLKAKVSFIKSDALSMRPESSPTYDLIVSNPPYIAISERAAMNRNVTDHEPPEALFVPDADPLRFYNAIMRYAKTALMPGGRIYFEINPLYHAQLKRNAATILPQSSVDIINDIYGKLRFAVITTPNDDQ